MWSGRSAVRTDVCFPFFFFFSLAELVVVGEDRDSFNESRLFTQLFPLFFRF